MNLEQKVDELEQVEAFRYLWTVITEDTVCIEKAKIRITLAKGSFNRNKYLLYSEIGLLLKGRLTKCMV